MTNTKETKKTISMTKTKEIYLAGGCFWGTEHFFKQVRGVIATEVGYANGHTEYPTYEEVCQHNTGFAETVHITYAPEQISLDQLLDLYFLTTTPPRSIAREVTSGISTAPASTTPIASICLRYRLHSRSYRSNTQLPS